MVRAGCTVKIPEQCGLTEITIISLEASESRSQDAIIKKTTEISFQLIKHQKLSKQIDDFSVPLIGTEEVVKALRSTIQYVSIYRKTFSKLNLDVPKGIMVFHIQEFLYMDLRVLEKLPL